MSGNMQKTRVYVSILLMIVVTLSVFQITKEEDLAFAPMGDDGWLPKPLACLGDFRKVPNCVKAVKHFQFKNVTKECCSVLLNLPEHCLGVFFPVRFSYRVALKSLCAALGIIRPVIY
ncbi:hypothetical protein CARUB_v10019012mg [Capsella rubella]|uniref:Prolamin-like domain-containing protein n=1 Tax=Capsella rubella TaxID=81985 RepID=R0FT79_9BRAS|nr:hypothetical protein CARUB_v10019012mg [Capsella rubella]